jgi:hypothetical protein
MGCYVSLAMEGLDSLVQTERTGPKCNDKKS